MRVFINGEDRGTVDAHSSTWQFQQPLFTAQDLGAGPHLLKVVYDGGGTGITVDAVDAESVP
jgi:hypothetical protein